MILMASLRLFPIFTVCIQVIVRLLLVCTVVPFVDDVLQTHLLFHVACSAVGFIIGLIDTTELPAFRLDWSHVFQPLSIAVTLFVGVVGTLWVQKLERLGASASANSQTPSADSDAPPACSPEHAAVATDVATPR